MNQQQVSVKGEVSVSPKPTRSKRRRLQRKRAKVLRSIAALNTESETYDNKPLHLKSELSECTGEKLLNGAIKTEKASPANLNRRSLIIKQELVPGIIKLEKLEVSEMNSSKSTAPLNEFPELKPQTAKHDQSNETKQLDGPKMLVVTDINKMLSTPKLNSGHALNNAPNSIPKAQLGAPNVAPRDQKSKKDTQKLESYQYHAVPFDRSKYTYYNIQNEPLNYVVKSLPFNHQGYLINSQWDSDCNQQWNWPNNLNSNRSNQTNQPRQHRDFRAQNWNDYNRHFHRQINQRREHKDNWNYQNRQWNTPKQNWNSGPMYLTNKWNNTYQDWNVPYQNYKMRNRNYNNCNNWNMQKRSYPNPIKQQWAKINHNSCSSNSYWEPRQPHWNAQNTYWDNESRRWNQYTQSQYQGHHIKNEFQYNRTNYQGEYRNYDGSQMGHPSNTQSQYQDQHSKSEYQFNSINYHTEYRHFYGLHRNGHPPSTQSQYQNQANEFQINGIHGSQIGNPPNQTSTFVNWQGPKVEGNFNQNYYY